MKKFILCFLSIIMLVSCSTVGIQAESTDEGIMPCWSNGSECTMAFGISETGLASAQVSFTGITGVTTQVRSEIYIQKRVLGIFWKKVDIGVEDNVWVDVTTEDMYFFYHSTQLEDTGTYRAVFELTFSGTAGDDDVTSHKIEYTYG
ncbi:MAG: hypothetical protein IJW55_00855 [Clostridia bacterium]|nr:hypothetical protein [Clostridia bacterium]